MKENKLNKIIGILVATLFLPGFGIFMIFNALYDMPSQCKTLFTCLEKGVPKLYIGFLFVGLSIYNFFYFIFTVVLPPAEMTMYLKRLEEDICIFLDKKGKVFKYKIKNVNNIETNNYYNVMVQHNNIIEILNKSYSNEIPPREKQSYFLNFYSPIVSISDLAILPFIYYTFFFMLFFLIISTNLLEIISTLIGLLPCLFLIVYDLIFKIKMQKMRKEIDLTGNNDISDKMLEYNIKNKNFTNKQYESNVQSKFTNKNAVLQEQKNAETVGRPTLALSYIVSIVIIIYFLFRNPSVTIGFILFILLIVFLFLFFHEMIKINKESIKKLDFLLTEESNKKANDFCVKIISVFFFIAWYSFLIFLTKGFIKEKEYSLILFLLPFYIVGIVLMFFIRK